MSSDNGKIQIYVAIIGVIGVIAAALISSWDKIFPHQSDEVLPEISLPIVSESHPTRSEKTDSSTRNEMGELAAPVVTGTLLNFDNLDEWQDIGYWDYDAIDGQHLAQGLVLRAWSDGNTRQKTQAYLELKTHDTLRTRHRTLWPVQINLRLRKVCANYPGYPTYQAYIDFPGEDYDGSYFFEACPGRG